MPHKHVELSQTGIQGRPHDDHEHMKMHRLNESLPVDKSHYLLAVIIEVDAGKPIPAYYHGPTVGYLIEGEVHFEDESKPGEVTKVVAGDVIHLDHETRVIFSTPTKGKIFGVSYAPSHLHPEDYIVKK